MPADSELRSILDQLHNSFRTNDYSSVPSMLSKAKLALLQLNALLPRAETPTPHLELARETLELGALLAIRHRDPDTFVRYYQQLQPFYSLDTARLNPKNGNANKITGLYLLLLLSQGDYLSFHMVLEGLEQEGTVTSIEDAHVQYPVRLEQALMEGSYDRVWGETKGDGVPGEEFALFSEVLIPSIRHEIASCSERAYTSIPLSNAKNLLFLESEGAVAKFASERGWLVKDGRIWFEDTAASADRLLASSAPAAPSATVSTAERDVLSASGQVIENALGYARELETIV